MKITVRYFAHVREALGPLEELSFTDNAPATVGQLRQWLSMRSPAHAQALGADRTVRTAFQQEMCGPDQVLRDGAEVAFFPPVTGG